MKDEIQSLKNENDRLNLELKVVKKELATIFELIHENSGKYQNNLEELQKLLASDFSDPDLKKIIQSEILTVKSKIDDKNKLIDSANRTLQKMDIRLSEADKSKSEFIANTSHELRTPLNAIMGYLELVREGLYDSVEEMRDFIDGAQKSASHLLKLLNDIIDIARIESGKLSVHFSEVNLKDLLETIHNQNHAQAVKNEMEFQLDLPEENIKVRGDEDKIKQIFNNLLSNAFKFSKRKGKIVIKAREILSKNHVLCEVIDNGIGISPENRKKIFDKFFMVDGSTTREYGGAGLGLSITKSLIEFLGGFIGVYSEGKDKGTRFYFTLPLYNYDEEFNLNEKPVPEDITIHGNPEDPLILIVEDDYHYRQVLTGLFTKNGFSTAGAFTADDGLSRVKEFRPKLVVLDFGLPRREYSDLHNGVDLFRLLQNQPEFEKIPVILISGHSMELIKMFYEKLDIKVDRFFEKPIDSNSLLLKVKEIIKI